uniref:Uncharacterized protein n=1 Tax=Arundo donax TaxID=35708 RepID=A0A0A9BE30_ARUDO
MCFCHFLCLSHELLLIALA